MAVAKAAVKRKTGSSLSLSGGKSGSGSTARKSGSTATTGSVTGSGTGYIHPGSSVSVNRLPNGRVVAAKDSGSSVPSSRSGTSSYTGGGSGSKVISSTGGSAGSIGKASSPSYSGSVDYHKQASDAAARGDWGAVEQALTARQNKINAQGGNDRGVSNAQILSQLRSQYGGSYGGLTANTQNRLSLSAGEKLPFTNYKNESGSIYKDKGWEDGVDYLARASEYASRGDLDGAYDALMRRGSKMYDTGSSGGGTSQDQAYALIHKIYSQSEGAQRDYQNRLAANQKNLQEHQTQFGLETRPELAYKQFKSADGKYWITYDGQGRPALANPVSARLGAGKPGFSDAEIDLRSQYYGGQGDRAELERQIHNLDVVRTGAGRLVNSDGSWASGTPVSIGSAEDWRGLDTSANTNQDRAALQAILDRMNDGEIIGSPEAVGNVEPDTGWKRLTGGVRGNAMPGGTGGGSYGGGSGGYGGYGGDDLTAYLRQVYDANLQAQLAALEAAYRQNVANYQAHDDLLSQGYRDQRNQAAAQNDLQRLYMAEMGAMQGLNTGAAGQLALAQSAAYQGSLADLWAAESQDRAENDLAMRNLAAVYQGDMASAAAQSNAQLAQALYSEYVRQIQAEEAARQAAQAQANWQAQFDYQKQQDALSQQNWQAQWDASQQADRQSGAYKLAYAMLQNGVMPDGGTLDTAGISRADAQAIVESYAAQLAAQAARSASGSGRSTGGGSASAGKPRLTYAQAVSAIENGQVTDAVRQAYDYYMGNGAYDQYYGKTGTAAGGTGPSDQASPIIRSLTEQLNGGHEDRAILYLDFLWKSQTLTEAQKQEVRDVLDRYGVEYER